MDFINSKTFYINEETADLLKEALEGVDYAEMNDRYGSKWQEILTFLMANKLILFTEKAHIGIFHDEWNFGFSIPIDMENIPEIKVAYINFGSDCSLDCEICETPRLFPCMSCQRLAYSNKDTSTQKRTLNKKLIYKFIVSLVKYGCTQVIITGGDPLKEINDLLELLKSVSKHKLRFLIVTNGILLNKEIVSELAKYNVFILLQIVKNDSIYNKEVVERIELLKKYHISFQAVFNLPNDYILENFDKKNFIFNFIVDTNDFTSCSIPKSIAQPSIYSNLKKFNKCLWHKIYLSDKMAIYPCVGFHKKNERNLGCFSRNTNIAEKIVELEKLWNNSLSINEKCSYCLLKNICVPCLVNSHSITDTEQQT